MNKTLSLLLAAVLGCGLAGCQGLGWPNWRHPGPAVVQQGRAQRFDPYPENESGPPIVGGRPREYEKPLSEPLRARWFPWSW